MAKKVQDKVDVDPQVRSQGNAARELLEEARGLAVQIERLLTSPRCDFADTDNFRIRLARAHTLSLLDQLAELVGPSPALCDSREVVEEGAASGIRTAWR